MKNKMNEKMKGEIKKMIQEIKKRFIETGLVRKVDEMGQIVIPKEVRRVFGIGEGSQLEILTTNDGEIVLRKYKTG